jgi:HPt (histidine-containing phosphotransfer) domain-containing protein
MRVNQAEFQSGLEAFHKAIDKLLAQIPSGEKELEAQKEFMQKFEAAFARVQEQATEAMNDNSLRLQEILAEFLNKEKKSG